MRSQAVLAGKYRLEERIGRGGFSVVFRAKHIEMGRAVAIKVVKLAQGGEQESNAVAQFTQEARIVSQLRSPHTVTVFDYGREGALMYLVMEYIEGRALGKELKRVGGKMEEARVVQCGMDVLSSLEEAHRIGVLHRDLKPGNIMVTLDHRGEEQFKVLDFGIATWLDMQEQGQGGLAGTPRYASPEQLLGKQVAKESDLYSLGAVMWTLLTGAPMVGGLKGWGEVSAFHLQGARPRLPESVDRGVREIVERACARDPRARWRSAAQMREALESWKPEVKSWHMGQVVDPNVGPIPLFEDDEVVALPPIQRTGGTLICHKAREGGWRSGRGVGA